jgi:rhamnosyltransferase
MTMIAGVVILYNPNDSVYDNIITYSHNIDKLFVIDNSEKSYAIINKIRTIENVKYIKNEENMGISYSLNLVLKYVNKQYDYLLTMDQDSFFTANDIKKYIEKTQTYFDESIIAIVPNINSVQRGVRKGIEVVERCITSGSIVDINKANFIGGWDEELFIDEVDYEFCYRANEKGFHTLCVLDVSMNTRFGDEKEYMFLGMFKCSATNHNYIRQYYIARNRLYNMNRHPQCKVFTMKTALKWIIKIIIVENDKKRKLRSICNGILDYYRGKMGKKIFNY